MSTQFDFVQCQDGSYTLNDKSVNQWMHSLTGPETEFKSIYLKGSKLEEKLLDKSSSLPLVIDDIGLGIGANAVGAINVALSLKNLGHKTRPLHIRSYENNLTGFKYALKNLSLFPHLTPPLIRKACDQILLESNWSSQEFCWFLYEGDFLKTFSCQTLSAEILFYDFYSPAVTPQLWNQSTFLKIREKLHHKAVLITYSAATSVRLSLLSAGFYVGYGEKTRFKQDSTQAATNMDLIARPLKLSWLKNKLESHHPHTRSQALSLFKHPQFLL